MKKVNVEKFMKDYLDVVAELENAVANKDKVLEEEKDKALQIEGYDEDVVAKFVELVVDKKAQVLDAQIKEIEDKVEVFNKYLDDVEEVETEEVENTEEVQDEQVVEQVEEVKVQQFDAWGNPIN